ncbi:MAG TPA: FecR family protein, partial [Thermoanaerobaculia bacterium]
MVPPTLPKNASRLALAGLLALAVSAAPLRAENGGSYGYIRVLEGSASLTAAGAAGRAAAEMNQPLQVGDRVTTADRGRAELVLPDQNIVRLDGGSDLVLEKLAASPDGQDTATVLRLFRGNLQLVVTRDSLGDELPRVETPNASIFIEDFGAFRVTADHDDWSEVLVRKGAAQIVTDQDTVDLHADDDAVVSGDRAARVDVASAGSLDSLERGGRDLAQAVSQADVRNVAPSLRYQAASLGRYGRWVDVEGQSYWRPDVDDDWRPYSRGSWTYTPSGLTWVSNESWGWVPYHYGTWSYLPSYGWAWAPGAVYAPAWVYWYWGPTYVGWCPTGFYTSYYGSAYASFGFHFGVYGWAGGDWGLFSRWNFVPVGHFGRRDLYRYAVPVRDLRDHGRFAQLPRGIITTDTRQLTPRTWRDPRQAMQVLSEHPTARRVAGQLPNVTPFIARQPKLPTAVAQSITAAGGERGRLQGTPLLPQTLGQRPAVRTIASAGPRPPAQDTRLREARPNAV